MSNKGKRLTDFEQGQVIALKQQKMSNRAITKRLGRTEGTIRCFLKKYDEIGAPGRREGSGRPRATTEREDRRIVRAVKCDRRTSVKVIREKTGLEHLSLSTIKRRIREGGFFGGWSNKKPHISPKNRQCRIKWCKEHLNWTSQQWQSVFWSDESPYTIRGSTRFRVWRLPNERYIPVVTKMTVKHSEKILVWGCFWPLGLVICTRFKASWTVCGTSKSSFITCVQVPKASLGPTIGSSSKTTTPNTNQNLSWTTLSANIMFWNDQLKARI